MNRSEIARLIKANPHTLGKLNLTEIIKLNEESPDKSMMLSALAFINENPYSEKFKNPSWQGFVEREDPEFATLLKEMAANEEKTPEQRAAVIEAAARGKFNLTEALAWAEAHPDEYSAAVSEANAQGCDVNVKIIERIMSNQHAKVDNA